MEYSIYPNSDGDSSVRQDIARMIRRHELTRDRSLQAALGPSQIGVGCDRSLAYLVSVAEGEPDRGHGTPHRNDPLPAIIGTAMHAWMEDAAEKDDIIRCAIEGSDPNPRWRTEVDVAVTTPAGRMVPGSIDLWDSHTFTVIDYKVLGSASMRRVKAEGPSEQYHAQIQLYALGMEQTHGYVPVNVALCLIPRNGTINAIQYVEFPYDPEFALSVLERYDRVVEQGEASGWESMPAAPDETRCRYCPVPMTECAEGLTSR